VTDPGAEAAIGTGEHILAPDEVGVAHEPLGHEIGMLDKVGAIADYTRDQSGAFR
jgi:hypothetical protein